MRSKRITKWLKASVCTLIVATPMFAVTNAAAKEFPTRAITLVSPYAPGGINDIMARLIAVGAEKELGQSVIVLNRTGAGGSVGAASVARSAPDGYTILMGALAPLAVSKLMDPSIPYDPREFQPVVEIGRAPTVLTVNVDVPVNSVAELIKHLKEKPDSFSYSSPGPGTPQHLSGVLFNQAAHVKMTHIPYRGSGPSLIGLVGGQVQVTFENIPPLLPYIQANRVRPLAVLASSRLSVIPDVPTMAEAGIENLEVSGWYGIVAPEGTPSTAVDTLRKAITKVLKTPEIHDKLTSLGMIVSPGSSEDFGNLIHSEFKRWQPIIQELGLSKN